MFLEEVNFYYLADYFTNYYLGADRILGIKIS